MTRRVVLVLGMHRSGTSVLAGILQKLGLTLGDALLPAAEDNPKGFFENTRIVDIEQRLLVALDRDWHDPMELPDHWMADEAAEAAAAQLKAELAGMFDDGHALAVKDPRASRLVPLWSSVATALECDLGAVVMVRSPFEVAASLSRRDGMTFRRAGLLWLRYMLDAERDTRTMPRVFVSHASLLADWRSEVARIGDVLAVDLVPDEATRAEVAAFLDPSLHRHREPERPDAHVELVGLLADAEHALTSLCGGEAADAAEFDRLRTRMDGLAGEYAELVRLERQHLDQTTQAAAFVQLWQPTQLPQGPAFAKLYWRLDDEEYSERRSLGLLVRERGGSFVARFSLPADVRADFIRFDPDEVPGIFGIGGIRIDGVSLGSPQRRVTAASELTLPAPRPGTTRIAAVGGDPHLEFDLRGVAGGKALSPATVQVRFYRETLARMLEEWAVGFDERLGSLETGLMQGVGQLVAANRQLAGAMADNERQRRTDTAAGRDQVSGLQSTIESLRAELAVVREDQRLLKSWAQRRSLSYWWRRLGTRSYVGPLGLGARARLEVSPLANVRRSGDEATRWVAESDDPQLLIRPADGASGFRAGWYRFTVQLDAMAGRIAYPCAYADYGEGFSEATRITLPLPDAAGRIDAIALLRHDARGLRFDPTTAQSIFSMGDMRLVRMSRTRASWAMLRTIAAQADAGWKPAAGVVVAALGRAASGSARSAGDLIRSRYVASLNSHGDDYARWIEQFDAIDARQIEAWHRRAADMTRVPLLSVLMPTYNTPEKWLRRVLDSVVAQAYPHWELCIADDASRKPHVRRVLEEYSARDPRIRVVFRETNGHISAASNSALELASGEFVVLLDHDDELAPHALLEVAEAIVAHPEWQLIYSDEDKIDEQGRRFDPYFKPDWNYDLFLAQNCVCHLGAYRTARVRAAGGFRKGFEGSQDWDLALRFVEGLQPHEIGHIPKVLYHWRAIPGSTAMGVDEKNYAAEAGRRAIREHLERTGQPGSVEVIDHGHLRVRRTLPGALPKVSLVIPTRDRVDLLRMCVQSILEKTDYPSFEVLVVDNQSVDPATHAYFYELEADPRVRVIPYDAPFNYSAINNHAIAQTDGDVIGLVNNDIEVISGEWLREMVSHALRADVGAVGAMLYYPDDTIQHAGVILGIGGVAGHVYVGKPRGFMGHFSRAKLVQEMSAVTAACLLVRRTVLEEVGGLDERLSVAFNDIDLCLRIRNAGYRNVWTPFAELYHHESASRGYEDTPEKQQRFRGEVAFMQQRWGELLLEDPSYNVNLSLCSTAFELAFPPRRQCDATV